MESIDPVLVVGVIALVCGVLIGMLISRISSPSSGDVEQLKAELERERSETARYKASVDEHFNKTSELVNDLTQDYVKVYRHLAEGAQTLSGVAEFNRVLEQAQGRVLISVDEAESGAEETPVAEEGDVASDEPTPQDAAPRDEIPKDYVAADSGDTEAANDEPDPVAETGQADATPQPPDADAKGPAEGADEHGDAKRNEAASPDNGDSVAAADREPEAETGDDSIREATADESADDTAKPDKQA